MMKRLLLMLCLLGGVARAQAPFGFPPVSSTKFQVGGTTQTPTPNFVNFSTGLSGSLSGGVLTITVAGGAPASTYLPLAGGTMSGDITLANSSSAIKSGAYTWGAASSIASGATAAYTLRATNDLSSSAGGYLRIQNNGTTDVLQLDGFSGSGGRFHALTNAGYATASSSFLIGNDALTGYVQATSSTIDLSTASGYLLELTTGLFTGNDLLISLGDGTHRYKRLFLKGTALVNTDFALSAGWGASASVGTITASDDGGTYVVTSAGAGQAANPTITLTFKDGTFTNAPNCEAKLEASSDVITTLITETTSATQMIITYNGTPVATKTYTFRFFCFGM